MACDLMISGIYDQDTFKFLKEMEIFHFGFDFTPRSFNFLPEYVFYEKLLPLVSSKDHLYFFFDHNLDPMWKKIYTELSLGQLISTSQLTFVFKEWRPSSSMTGPRFMFHYHTMVADNFKQAHMVWDPIFDFSILERLYLKGHWNSFIGNFFLRFPHMAKRDEKNKNILLIDWDSHLIPSLLESLEINVMCLPINRKVEICYRNVNTGQLKKEILIFSKNL